MSPSEADRSPASPRPAGRRYGVLAVRVVALAALVVVLVFALLPPERFIYGSVPIGPDEVVFLTRRNEDDATYFWIELATAAGDHRWSAEITPAEARDSLGFTSVAGTHDRVIVLASSGGDAPAPVVLALDRKDGRILWRTPLPGTLGTMKAGRIGPMIVTDDKRAFVLHEVAEGPRSVAQLDVLALDGGTRLWGRAPVVGALDLRVVGPDRVMLAGDPADALVELDAATGAPLRRLDATGAVRCATADALVSGSLTEPVRVPVAAGPPATRLALPAGWRVGGPCGFRAGDVVAVLELGEPRESGVTRIDPASGAPRWHLSLGPGATEPPALADGRLPRFYPLSLWGTRPTDGGLAKEVVVVDLDAGAIVSRRSFEGQHVVVLATAERAYLSLPFAGVLIAIDPATGALSAATSFPDTSSSETRAEDIRHGRLWIHGNGWAAPGRLPWAVYDLANARVEHAHGGLVPGDVTAAFLPRPGS